MIPQALDIAKQIAAAFEGLRLVKYLCPAGIPTIGRGHAIRQGENLTRITEEEADILFDRDMSKALSSTLKQCPVLIRWPEKLGAVTDFVFNLGAGRLQCSTLRRRINQRDWQAARCELNKWVYGGGRKLPGLVLRRKAEARYL